MNQEKEKMIKEEILEEEPHITMTKSEIMDIIYNYDRNNANQVRSAGALEYTLFENVAKKFMYTQYDDELKDSIDAGMIYPHDSAQELYKGINCFTLDPRFILRKGVYSNGDTGHLGCVTKPAKRFNVAIEHLAQTLGLASTCIAGGVAIASLNCFLAPYITDLDDKEIYQAIQAFAFQMNEAFKNRGSQSLFSSINLDLEMPKFIKEQPAVGPEGKYTGKKYEDYQEEAKKLAHIITEVFLEGDGANKPLFFPNLIYNIDGADLSEWDDVFDLTAKFSSPYFAVPSNNNDVEYASTLGCLDGSEGIWTRINGNVQYYTFKELSDMFNADYGVTNINKYNIEVMTINDDRKIIWHKVSNFIKNKDRLLYKVDLSGNKSFICDDTHDMITYKGLNRINVLDCTQGSNLLDVNCTNINVKVNQDYIATLYGFWLGDGVKNYSTGNKTSIGVQKEDKKEYLEKIFELANIDYNLHISNRKIDDKHKIPKYYNFSFDKSIFDNLDLKDNNVLAGILAGCLSSDGYVRINGKYNNSLACEWVSTNPEYTKLFKYCCFNLGIKFNSRLIKGVKKHHSGFERVYISCNHLTISLMKQLFLRQKQQELIDNIINNYRYINETKGQRIKNIELYGKGDSYCIEVNDRMIFGEDFILSSQCRTSLPSNWTGDPNIDCMGTGNAVYTTISLPAVALKAKEDDINFFKLLEEQMEIVRKYTLKRYERIKWLWYKQHLADFMIQELDGKPLYRLEDATLVIGYLGLSNAMEILYGKKLHEDNESARKIMIFMRDKIAEYKKEDKLRWGLFQTPAENCCHSLAKMMVNKYGFEKSKAKGTPENPYYTNSNHIDVDANINILDRIRIEGYNQPLGAAGNIMNLYTSEAYSDPIALRKLVTRIRDLTSAYFFAITGEYSICPLCGTTYRGNKDKCIFDDAECDCISRITGYLGNILSWNDGKKEEFKDRKRY